MTSPTKMLFAAVALGAGLSGTGVVYAANDANFNKCWGQTTKQFAQVSDSQPGIGEHSSNPPGIDPGEGRRGVGNVSKEDFGPLSAGGQGLHANTVGMQMGVDSCEGAPVP